LQRSEKGIPYFDDALEESRQRKLVSVGAVKGSGIHGIFSSTVHDINSAVAAIREGTARYGNLSYMLGGRSSHQNVHESSLDGPIEKWKPDLTVVKTVIK
jgi:hypothetical protein